MRDDPHKDGKMKWVAYAVLGLFCGLVVGFMLDIGSRLRTDQVTSSYDPEVGVLCIRSTVGLSHSISCVRYVPGTAL